MNELLYVLQERLNITHPSVVVFLLSVADQKLGAGSAIIAYDSWSKCKARLFLTDRELSLRLLSPSSSALALAWDMRTLLDENGTELEPQFLEVLSLLQ